MHRILKIVQFYILPVTYTRYQYHLLIPQHHKRQLSLSQVSHIPELINLIKIDQYH